MDKQYEITITATINDADIIKAHVLRDLTTLAREEGLGVRVKSHIVSNGDTGAFAVLDEYENETSKKTYLEAIQALVKYYGGYSNTSVHIKSVRSGVPHTTRQCIVNWAELLVVPNSTSLRFIQESYNEAFGDNIEVTCPQELVDAVKGES